MIVVNWFYSSSRVVLKLDSHRDFKFHHLAVFGKFVVQPEVGFGC